MTISTASVPTTKPSAYLQQLCKHFGHKIPVEFTPEAGRITFEMGIAELEAADDALILRVTGDDIERLENVVASHLERFAFREELKVVWTRA
ncbi:DUF2218 domain-containing protein [Falsirhodobacter xinxiangensis]|uniref:DUF2218 domain-containing protein n=1 Tax=Falsirhodobacter xinxiangensis TaxID=2530049 RepID=UPI0010A9F66C|nr:DUF2218 domain-containing protein [Rhodobacter xinxiangensis]